MEAKTVDKSELVVPEGSIWGKLHLVGLALAVIGLGAWYSGFSADNDRGWYSPFWLHDRTVLGIGLHGVRTHSVHRTCRLVHGRPSDRRKWHDDIARFALLFIPVALGAHDLFIGLTSNTTTSS